MVVGLAAACFLFLVLFLMGSFVLGFRVGYLGIALGGFFGWVFALLVWVGFGVVVGFG